MSDNFPQSVLITNLSLAGYTGSELHVVDLARAFRAQGASVTCFTLVTAQPILGMLKAEGVRVIEYSDVESLAGSYDLLIAQHHVVSDYVAALPDVTFDKAVISSLGPGNFHEAVPAFASKDDTFVFVSEECLNARADEVPAGATRLVVFPNYFHKDFLALPARSFPETPKRIAVISNHSPHEVVNLSELPDIEATIDFIGGDNAVLVDAKLLSRYDLVISIGRTCLDAFAGQIPLFCYDHFGGPGYINPAEIEIHAAQNFSGRSAPHKLETSELWEHICVGYAQAVADLQELRSWVIEHHSFDVHMDSLLEIVREAPIRSSVPATASALVRQEAACYAWRLWTLDQIGTAQLFYGEPEEEETEELSIRIPYRYGTQIDINLASLGIPSNHIIKRFDPDMRPCHCTLFSPSMDAFGVNNQDGNITTFYTNDPCYCPMRPLAPEGVLSFNATPLNEEEYVANIDEKVKELAEQQQTINSILAREQSIRWVATHLRELLIERARNIRG